MYKIGDRLGPHQLELLELTKTTSYNHRYGLFKCECGNKFEAKLYHITSGSTFQCKECRSNSRKGKNNHNFKDLTNNVYGKLKVIKYIGNKQVGIEHQNGKILTQSLWECKCECGNIIEKTTNELERNCVQSCPDCRMVSIGEEKIKQILKELNITFLTQYKIKECKDIFCLPFDFYLPNYNILIEYDGLGHYEVSNRETSWRTKENVELTQKHDNIKTQYCKDNNIKFIRIPYYNYNQLSKEYLLSLINQ